MGIQWHELSFCILRSLWWSMFILQEEAEQLQPQQRLDEGQQQLRGQALHELRDREDDLLRGCQAPGELIVVGVAVM